MKVNAIKHKLMGPRAAVLLMLSMGLTGATGLLVHVAAGNYLQRVDDQGIGYLVRVLC